MPSPSPEAINSVSEDGGSAITSEGGDGSSTVVIILGVSAGLLLLGCALGAKWVHKRTAALNAQHVTVERQAKEDKATSVTSRALAFQANEDNGPPRQWPATVASIQRSSATTPPIIHARQRAATTPPILTSGTAAAAPTPAAVLRAREGPRLSQSREHVAEPVSQPSRPSQPSAPTPTSIRQGQAHWLTAQADRISPTRMAEESAELDPAQAQAAGLELDAPDRQPQEIGLELDSPDRQPQEMDLRRGWLSPAKVLRI